MERYCFDDPAFRALVLPNAELLTLGAGFAWLEGPVWCADANQLLVSDLPNDRILRWTEDGGIGVFRQPSGFANGHTRDRAGRPVAAERIHAGAIGHTQEVLRQLVKELARNGALAQAPDRSVLCLGQDQMFLGPGNADEAEASLFLQLGDVVA